MIILLIGLLSCTACVAQESAVIESPSVEDVLGDIPWRKDYEKNSEFTQAMDEFHANRDGIICPRTNAWQEKTERLFELFRDNDATPEQRRAFITRVMRAIAIRNGREFFDPENEGDLAVLTKVLGKLIGVEDVALHDVSVEPRVSGDADVDMHGRMRLRSNWVGEREDLVASILYGLAKAKHKLPQRSFYSRVGVSSALSLLLLLAGYKANAFSKAPVLSTLALLALVPTLDQTLGRSLSAWLNRNNIYEADATVRDWGFGKEHIIKLARDADVPSTKPAASSLWQRWFGTTATPAERAEYVAAPIRDQLDSKELAEELLSESF